VGGVPSPRQVEATETVDDAELPFPWEERELHVLFNKFDLDKDGEVHREDLPNLLRYIGARFEEGDIEKLVNEMTQYATLSWEEFFEFIIRFRQIDVTRLKKWFKEVDDDGSGQLDFEELEQLLLKMGYKPTREVVREAFEATDTDKSGLVSFREFEGLREHLRMTECFLKAEVEEITGLFNRAGGSKGEIVVEECWRISNFLGFSATPEDVARYSSEVDADGSGLVNHNELLQVMRLIRDGEAQRVHKVVRKYNVSKDATKQMMPVESLPFALAELGYFVQLPAIPDITAAIPRLENDHFFGVEDMQHFVLEFRKVEGFSQADAKQMAEVFKEESGDDGALSTLELGRVLRWFGFKKTLQETQKMAEEIDFDGSGQLELEEFMKLMRRLYQMECSKRYEIYKELEENRSGQVLVSSLPTAIAKLKGQEPWPAFLTAATKKAMALANGAKSEEPAKPPADIVGDAAAPEKDAQDVAADSTRRSSKMEDAERQAEFERAVAEAATLSEEMDKERRRTSMLKVEAMKKAKEDKAAEAEEQATVETEAKAKAAENADPEAEAAAKKVVAMPKAGVSWGAVAQGLSPSGALRRLEPVGGDDSEDSVGWPGLEAFFRQYKSLEVEQTRKNHLYSQEELARMQQAFNNYDKDRSGTVERGELAQLIAEYFPDATKSREGQQEILRFLAEVDEDGSGSLEFNEFVILMRKCDDQRDRKDLELEAKVVKECGFTAEEVDGFRQIFMMHVDYVGEIDLTTLADLLGQVVNLSEDQYEDLGNLVCELHPEGREVARFPQFLRLIKRMTEDKSWRVSEQAARVVKRANKRG